MSPTPTPEFRAELRGLHAKATPGEWACYGMEAGALPASHPAMGFSFGRLLGPTTIPLDKDWAFTLEDCRAIVAAHNALPGLLDALDAADARIEASGDLCEHFKSMWLKADAEAERLRAENAALRKVIAEAASLNNSDDNGARRVAARILGEALLGGQPT